MLGKKGEPTIPRPIEPRPLHCGWPLHEERRKFELGSVLDCSGVELTEFTIGRALGQSRSGWWECDLAQNDLTWTAGVYDIFGLPHGSRIAREEAVGLYLEDSRAAMERLRRRAIARGQGFVIDAKIRPASGGPMRWMRLIASPILLDGRAVRLQGLKLWL